MNDAAKAREAASANAYLPCLLVPALAVTLDLFSSVSWIQVRVSLVTAAGVRAFHLRRCLVHCRIFLFSFAWECWSACSLNSVTVSVAAVSNGALCSAAGVSTEDVSGFTCHFDAAWDRFRYVLRFSNAINVTASSAFLRVGWCRANAQLWSWWTGSSENVPMLPSHREQHLYTFIAPY